MLRVSITSEELREMRGVSKGTQKPYHMTIQQAWIHTFTRKGEPNPYPEKVELILDRDETGAAIFYKVGEYQLAPSSIYVDARGSLAVAPRLMALRAAPKAAA